MSILVLYNNLYIPISVLEEKVAPLEKVMNWGRKCNVFHDEHLYHEGFMSGPDLENAIEFWKNHGLEYDEDKNYGDMCAFTMLGYGRDDCQWLSYTYNEEKKLFEVWHTEFPKGKLYGPTKEHQPE